MLTEAIELQREKVAEIVGLLDTQKKEIVFRAPTGSGKTRMMADVMNRILSQNDDVIFIVSAPSSGGIAKQDFDSFDRLAQAGVYPYIKPVLVSSEGTAEQGVVIPRGYNVYVLPSALLGAGRRVSKGGAMDDFLVETTKIYKRRIYVIRDECHTDTSNLNAYEDDFDKIIHVSATPAKTVYYPNRKGELDEDGNVKTSSKKELLEPDVEITDIEAVSAKMIKDPEFVKEYDKKDKDVGLKQADLMDAFEKLVELRKAYEKHSVGMRPCLIIQIDNSGKGLEELNGLIKPALQAYKRDKEIDLQWAYIATPDKRVSANELTNDKGLLKCPYKTWKELVKSSTSPVDVIIFKMTIKEGYDIPRACILYQIRNTGSKTLDEQVLGRIRRNPRISDFESLDEETQAVCLRGYVWGVKPENKNVAEVRRAFAEGDFLITPTRLKVQVENRSYDTRTWLDSIQTDELAGLDIFSAYKDIQSSLSPEMYEEYRRNVDCVEDWYKFMEHSSSLKAKVDTDFSDYGSSMILAAPVAFPEYQKYTITSFEDWFHNWMWEELSRSRHRKDKNLYSFDSQAEKGWANVLDKAVQNGYVKKDSSGSVFLVGKNHESGGNSEVYFEYYDETVKKSYPDFILKNQNDSVHIFESKSLNRSKRHRLDGTAYRHKVDVLLSAYQHASILTGYHFYIPVLKGDAWTIWWCYQGRKEQIAETDVIEIIRTM